MKDGALVTLALIGIVAAALLALVPLIGAAVAFDSGPAWLGWVLLGLTALLAYFVLIFSTVAIVLAASEVLDGRDATVGAAIAGAMRRVGPIAAWAVVGAAINLFFAIVRERGGLAGSILAGVGSAAWSLVTFLAVPIIAFEGLGPLATLKRSTGLFRERWGEQLTGNISINAIFVLLSIPAIGIAGLGVAVAGPLGIVLIVVGAIALATVLILGRAASATFGAILYRYAATGESVGPMDADELAAVARATG